jgi:phosphopantetheinyl transferase (holo-ACP synthase)
MIEEILRSFLASPSLVFKTNAAWSARLPNCRAQIRAAVSQLVGESVEDLSSIPDSSKMSISISHCPGLGGFALTEKPACIGLDLEVASRVDQKHIARMASPVELEQMPSPAHLWAAKEAVFKCLRGPMQPLILTDLVVGQWQTYGHRKLEANYADFFSFSAALGKGLDLPGKGVAFREGDFITSLFCLRTPLGAST